MNIAQFGTDQYSIPPQQDIASISITVRTNDGRMYTYLVSSDDEEGGLNITLTGGPPPESRKGINGLAATGGHLGGVNTLRIRPIPV